MTLLRCNYKACTLFLSSFGVMVWMINERDLSCCAPAMKLEPRFSVQTATSRKICWRSLQSVPKFKNAMWVSMPSQLPFFFGWIAATHQIYALCQPISTAIFWNPRCQQRCQPVRCRTWESTRPGVQKVATVRTFLWWVRCWHCCFMVCTVVANMPQWMINFPHAMSATR